MNKKSQQIFCNKIFKALKETPNYICKKIYYIVPASEKLANIWKIHNIQTAFCNSYPISKMSVNNKKYKKYKLEQSRVYTFCCADAIIIILARQTVALILDIRNIYSLGN